LNGRRLQAFSRVAKSFAAHNKSPARPGKRYGGFLERYFMTPPVFHKKKQHGGIAVTGFI
jgi:hypothetical protein